MFFVFVAKCQLESIVAVAVLCSYLCNHTGTCFNNSAGCLLASGIEDTGHPDFFSNNTFHVCTIYACWIIGTTLYIPIDREVSIPVCHRPFLLIAEASAEAILVIALKPRHLFEMPTFATAAAGDRSTGSKQTLNGLFLCPQLLMLALKLQHWRKES